MKTITLKQAKASDFPHEKAVELLRKEMPHVKFAYPLDVVNNQYVARVVESEFPPPSKDEDGSVDEAEESGPPSGDDGGSDDEPPKEKSDKPKGEAKEMKLDEVFDLLSQIAQKMGIMPDTGPNDLDMGPDDPNAMGGPPPGPPTPDIGVPGQGEALPPPAVKHNMPGVPGGPSFSSVAKLWREDDGIGIEALKAEVASAFPGYQVAEVNRRMAKTASGYEGPVLLTTLVR